MAVFPAAREPITSLYGRRAVSLRRSALGTTARTSRAASLILIIESSASASGDHSGEPAGSGGVVVNRPSFGKGDRSARSDCRRVGGRAYYRSRYHTPSGPRYSAAL